ncbi:MAG: hypothetical protein ACLFT3_05455 [Cyclobacteriaceae bacterium]
MRRKYVITALLIFIILSSFYYYLGGFNTVKMSLATAEPYVVAGYSYDGRFDEDQFEDLFFKVREYTEMGLFPGNITVVNYDLLDEDQDSIRQLIGVRLEGDPLSIADSLAIDTIEAGRVVRAEIEAHPLVMPRPDKINRQIIDFALGQGVKLQDLTIEQYVSENRIVIDAPLLEE